MRRKLLLLIAVLGMTVQAAEAAGVRYVCGYSFCVTPGQTDLCKCSADSQNPGATATCQNWANVCWGGIPP